MKEELDLKFDTIGLISLVITFISIILSFNLSVQDIIISIGIFLLVISSYIYLAIRNTINNQGEEIKKLKEKINIRQDISDLKAKVEFLMNKRGKTDIIEVLIRIIQIGAIIFATYIIIKAFGFI